jgi:uncharacterized protein (TIGR04255 family)
MAQIRHLSKPPIREAILEFHIAPMVDIIPETVQQWELVPTYNNFSTQASKQLTFTFDQNLDAAESVNSRAIEGVFWKDDTRAIAAQIMRNRLTLNKLAPYTDFALVENEMRFFWKCYTATFQAEQIQRVGLRYINEIETVQALHHYIQPELLPTGGLAGTAARTYHRYEIRRSETLGALVQIVIDKEDSRLVVDIDTFSERPYQSSDETVWKESVEQLHTLKNELFFAIITEQYAKECE